MRKLNAVKLPIKKRMKGLDLNTTSSGPIKSGTV